MEKTNITIEKAEPQQEPTTATATTITIQNIKQMRDYKELEDLRSKLKTDYSSMLKNGVITKEEFKTCLLGMSLKIKENYEKSGFRTDYFPMQEVKK